MGMEYLKTLLDEYGIRGNVAEIGALKGEGSTPIFREHVREHGGEFYSLDLFPNERDHKAVLAKLDLPNTHAVKGYSVELGQTWPRERGTLDFLFIDGDHGFPRISPDGRQSGVALDILAWHPRINVGGILAFHDYTGTAEQFGEPSLMAVEHAVDGLCRTPTYEPVNITEGRGSIRAFVKKREDFLYPLHVVKAPHESIRPAWDRLAEEYGLGRAPENTQFAIHGLGATGRQVLDTILEVFGPDTEVIFTDSFTTEPGTAWDKYALVPFSDLPEKAVLVMGTIFEQDVDAFFTDAGKRHMQDYYRFYEFLGWCHAGRYGYL